MEKVNKMNLEFSLDYLSVIEEDKDTCLVSLDLCHLGVNRNKTDIDMDCIECSKETFRDKPIIYRLNNSVIPSMSTDVLEHARDGDATMLIAGHVPYLTPIEYVERDGHTYVRVIGVIHKVYLPTLMRIIEKRDGSLKISIEIIVLDGWQQDNGILKINKMKLRGIALLGRDVLEGIEGSEMNVIKYSYDDYNNTYLKFSKNTKYKLPLELKNNINDNMNNYLINKKSTNKDIDLVLNDVKDIVYNSYISHSKLVEIENSMKEHKDGDIYSLYGGNKMKEFIEGSLFAKKEDLGKGKAIKVNKSSEKMSDSSWGDVDKTTLRNKVLSAKNYKTLVKDVYLLVEQGWEESPSSKLKYPVMEIVGDTAVYNRGGLASALGYAKAEGDTKVVDRVESIYKKLGLDKEKEDASMTEEIKNKLDKDNKDIEEIKDDAEAQEDDVKEKEENVKKNKIEPHDKGEEGLEDDVDADKDYWEKKYAILENKLKEIEHAKSVEAMNALVKEYASCLGDEAETFKAEIAKFGCGELDEEKFSLKVYAAVAKNAKKAVEEIDETKKFSFMPIDNTSMAQNNQDPLESLAKKYRKGK